MGVHKLIYGFLAGALSVLLFHQAMVLVLHLMGFIPAFPWRTAPFGPLGVPVVVNQMFWGGLWGVAFAAVAGRIPIPNDIGRGVTFGVIGPWLLGNGVLVPLFKGGNYLFGLNPQNMWRGVLIGAAFGLGLGLISRYLPKR